MTAADQVQPAAPSEPQARAAKDMAPPATTCSFCTDYAQAVEQWWEEHQGEKIASVQPTYEDISGSSLLLTSGETLRMRCRRHKKKGTGHEAAALNPRALLRKKGLN